MMCHGANIIGFGSKVWQRPLASRILKFEVVEVTRESMKSVA